MRLELNTLNHQQSELNNSGGGKIRVENVRTAQWLARWSCDNSTSCDLHLTTSFIGQLFMTGKQYDGTTSYIPKVQSISQPITRPLCARQHRYRLSTELRYWLLFLIMLSGSMQAVPRSHFSKECPSVGLNEELALATWLSSSEMFVMQYV